MLGDKVHSPEDTKLLSLMRDGNRSAFDTLYDKYKKDVFREAYKRLSNEEQAKDITQDVFTALWVKGSQSSIDNLPGYLYIAIKNNVLRLMQRESKFVPIPDILLELSTNYNRADADLLYNELLRAYEALVESLPEQQRIIYKLRYNDNLTPDEIAEKLNLSPKTVRNHLGIALTRLKAAFMLVQVIWWFAAK